MRGRGGFIGANVTPASAAANSAAGGVWTVREAESLKRAGTWPKNANDPNWSTVAALVVFDAVDGGVISDLAGGSWSTSGSPTISSSPAQFQSAIQFPNSPASYISKTSNANLQIGTADLTLEWWLYPTARAAGSSPQFNSLLYSTRPTGASIQGFIATINPAGKLALFATSNNSSWNLFLGQEMTTSAIPLNQWSHVALTRSGSTYKGFFNGTNEVTVTQAGTPTDGSGSVFIGGDTNGERYVGAMDEFRLSRFVRYSSNFTPPSTFAF
jgi:hypothetical protein